MGVDFALVDMLRAEIDDLSRLGREARASERRLREALEYALQDLCPGWMDKARAALAEHTPADGEGK